MEKHKNYRILLITPEYPPHNTGGGGTVYKKIADSFAARGDSVTVFSADHTAETADQEVVHESQANLDLYRLPLLPNYLNNPMLITRTPLNSRSKEFLRAEIQRGKWDAVLCFSVLETITLFASKLLKKNDIPYCISIHGYLNPKLYNPLIGVVFKIYEKTLLKQYIDGAQRVFSTSSGNAPHITDQVIPNGLDREDLLTIREPIDIRKKHEIPEQNKVIFSLGRIEPNKGFQYVAKAVKDMKDITYIIGGPDKGYKQEIENLGTNNVIFTGLLPYEVKKNYFEQADIVAVPSLVEAFGITALEAVAFNKPIIVNPVGGLVDFLHDRKNSIYIDIENLKSIQSAISEILNDQKLRDSFASYDENLIGNYSWEKIVEKYHQQLIKFCSIN